MARLRPFFSFFGSKWSMAPSYPSPRFETIIEPFAGSAAYSLMYPDRNVYLADKDPVVVAVWKYLISVSEYEMSKLPILHVGDRVSDFDLSQEARWLMGFWINRGQGVPCDKVTHFGEASELYLNFSSSVT